MRDPDADSPDPAPKGTSGNKAGKPQENPQTAPADQNKKPQVIDEKSVQLLRGMFEQNGIDEKFVCGLYKINGIESVTQNMYSNIMNHIADIKKKQEEKK